MQEDSRINKLRLDYETFGKMAEVLDNDGPSSAAAIALIAEIGSTNEQLRGPARTTLANYVSRIAASRHAGNRENPESTSTQLQLALVSLFKVQHIARKLTEIDNQVGNLELVKLDLQGLDLSGCNHITGIDFNQCSFLRSHFDHITFSKVRFFRCDLNEASLYWAKFVRNQGGYYCVLASTSMDATNITGTDFSGLMGLEEKQLNEACYAARFPPLGLPAISISHAFNTLRPVPTGTETTLPTPWDFDQKKYMTSQEAEKFWKNGLGKGCKPRDRNGKPIKIVYPDETPEDKGEPPPPVVKDD